MISKNLIQLADAAGYDAISFELGKAKERADSQLFTEAVMRLGRATEATLYAVAREFDVDLKLHIPALAALQESLIGAETMIMKSGGAAEVKLLANVSKKLSLAVADLMECENSRKGISGERVRGNARILNELILVVGDPSSRRRLKKNKELLNSVMNQRNSGAHACPIGSKREIDPGCFPKLAADFQDFIRAVIEVSIGERSRRLMTNS